MSRPLCGSLQALAESSEVPLRSHRRSHRAGVDRGMVDSVEDALKRRDAA